MSSAPASSPEAPAAAPNARDELLECLLILARSHGATITRDGALAGLPVDNGRLTPALFARAAHRAGLSSKVVQQPLVELKAELLPAIILLEDERACVLLERSVDGQTVKLVYPELGDAPVSVLLADVEAQYLGRAIYARPRMKFDARSPVVKSGRHEHWFWGVIAENKQLYRDVLLAAFLMNIFAVAMPVFTMNVYDRVLPHQAFDTLWVLALGLLIVLATDVTLKIMRGRFVDLASSRADVKLSSYIMERVLGTRMEDRPISAGSFASNLRAFESVRDFIGSATVTTFVDLPFALIFVAVIAWIAWPMLLVILLGASAMVLYALAVQGRMHELAETTYRAGAQRNATLVEGLVGFETVKALGAESQLQYKWEQSAALLARIGAKLRLLSSTATVGAGFVQQFVYMSIIIVGVYLVSDHQLSQGGLIACTMLSSRVMAPLAQVSGLLVQFHTASTSLASLNEMMLKEVERPDEAKYVVRGALDGSIEFRDVTFKYPGQSVPALKNVSFKIKKGEKIAILGKVGSGKTTLEKLILGLYRPSGGAVLVDGIELRQIDPAELRRNIGYVQQDVMLFYGTMRENITMASPNADDAAVLRASYVSGLLDIVNSHPQGFDMIVGERGESLSGGQRQSVVIARSLINDPPILLLDEPTASMDHSSEEDLKARLREYALNKTMIVITHRTSLLDLVDRIIVMDGGRVMADGPREQVVHALRQGRIGKAA